MLHEKWIWHEKTPPHISLSCKRARIEQVCDDNKNNHLIDMINDAEYHFIDRLDKLTKMLEEVKKSIYLGSNIIKLSFLVGMYNLKARNEWSDNEFSQLLSLLGNILKKDIIFLSLCTGQRKYYVHWAWNMKIFMHIQ